MAFSRVVLNWPEPVETDEAGIIAGRPLHSLVPSPMTMRSFLLPGLSVPSIYKDYRNSPYQRPPAYRAAVLLSGHLLNQQGHLLIHI